MQVGNAVQVERRQQKKRTLACPEITKQRALVACRAL